MWISHLPGSLLVQLKLPWDLFEDWEVSKKTHPRLILDPLHSSPTGALSLCHPQTSLSFLICYLSHPGPVTRTAETSMGQMKETAHSWQEFAGLWLPLESHSRLPQRRTRSICSTSSQWHFETEGGWAADTLDITIFYPSRNIGFLV